MYGSLTVAVVVPAFNEADKIVPMVRSIPGFVDRIILVDDGSSDGTAAAAARAGRVGLEILRHPENRGVGRAIASGYSRALELGSAVVAVMAGDAQMHPADLPALLAPIASGDADYAKGNRFGWPGVARTMPPVRLLGNFILSWLTRLVTGCWHVFDSQCGYTAISGCALAALDLNRMVPRYGYPNDLLARLAAGGARVVDVPVRPVYGVGWRSGIRPWTVLYPISFVLLRAVGRRIGARLAVPRLTRRSPQPLLPSDPNVQG
jgi:glycosyltransferase involved in cell wall biosynthesis